MRESDCQRRPPSQGPRNGNRKTHLWAIDILTRRWRTGRASSSGGTREVEAPLVTADAIRGSCRRVLFGEDSYSWLILAVRGVQLQWAVQKVQMGPSPSCVLCLCGET
jgi:hypothetical protein